MNVILYFGWFGWRQLKLLQGSVSSLCRVEQWNLYNECNTVHHCTSNGGVVVGVASGEGVGRWAE